MKKEKEIIIRAKLINYTNQQLKISKNKNTKFLINSFTLEELEKKNLRCKEFFIVEKPQIFYNIDNNRSIIQNIYISNISFTSNIIIYPLSTRILSPNKKKNNLNIFDQLNMTFEKENSIGKDLKEITNKSQLKNLNVYSPVKKSSLIKKELWENKMRLSKKEIDFNNNFNCNYNSWEIFEKNIEKTEEKNENSKNEIEIFKSRQLSTDTLATEISKIIKISHNNKSINSFTISSLNSIIETPEEIKKAKKFAKKLKYYCRTLKNKKANIHKSNNNLKIKLEEINNNNKENIIDEDKINYKRIKSKKLISKGRGKFIIGDNENIIKLLPKKKIRSERNLKHETVKSTFVFSEDNYNTEQSTKLQNQNITIKNESKKKFKNLKTFKYNRKEKKRFTGKLTEKEKSIKKVLGKVKNNKIISSTFIKKIKSRIIDDNKRDSKIIKTARNIDDNKVKKAFIDTRNLDDKDSFETNFFQTKKLSSSKEIFISREKKNFEINYKDENSTINLKEKEEENKRNNHKKKSNKKTHNQKEKKNDINLNTKKINKTQRNRKKINIRKSATIYDADKIKEIINNSINKEVNKISENPKKRSLKSDLNSVYKTIQTEDYNTVETDDFNLLDEYLYKKKLKNKKIK